MLLSSNLQFFFSKIGWVDLVFSIPAISFLCFAIYQLWFHPLSKYPGPFLAKLTNLYAAYHGWHGDLHVNMQRCHERYGTFVRYGPDKLLINSNHGLQDIYGPRGQAFCNKGTAYMPMVPEEGAWTTMTSVHNERVRHKRRLVSSIVSNDALRAFGPRGTLYLDTFCSIIGESAGTNGWSSPRNMTVKCRELMIDIMSDFVFGQKIDVMTTPDLQFILDALGNYAWRMGIYKECPSLAKLQLERLLGYVKGNNLTQKWEQWGTAYTSAILDSDNSEGCRFSVFQNSFDPITKAAPPRAELSAEGFFLMLAGSDSSATTASAVFFYLTHYDEAYQKTAKEIRTAFAAVDEISSGTALSSCSYIHACITETLRLSPATVAAPWRDVRQSGLLISGEEIPPHCEVGTCIYAIQRHPDYFSDPNRFVPERWIPGTLAYAEQISKPGPALTPFGIGIRNCPGRSMALLNISLIVARTIWLYDFRKADGELGRIGEGSATAAMGRQGVFEFQLQATITSMSEGPYLVFRSRVEGDGQDVVAA